VPGIGKSAFAPLLISALARRGCKVIYDFKSDMSHVLVLLDFTDPRRLAVDMQMFSAELLLGLAGEFLTLRCVLKSEAWRV